ncbi:MAG: hypothetical protein WA581_07795 [Candidatus Acidiferrales bacterium]
MRLIVLAARSSLMALVITGLIGLPTMGASPVPLATVVSAQSARLANADAVPGADVYFDDDLVTNGGGSLRLAVGTSQLYLLEYSEAVLRPDQNKVEAKMYRGTVGFSTSAPDNLEVDTPFGVVRGADGSHVLGQISLLTSPNTTEKKIQVTSYQGTLVVVDATGASQRVAEGQSYIGTMASDTSGGGNNDVGVKGVGGNGIRWKRVLAVLIPVMLVTGGGIALYVEGSESCAQPNCTE